MKCAVEGCDKPIRRTNLCGAHYQRKIRHGHLQEKVPVGFRFHKMSNNKSPAYRSWLMMKNRCTNPKAADFKYYGGRGIKVCKRWLVFQNFFEDMGERPLSLSLDRIDVNRNYSKSNCRWATRLEQRQNRRDSI